MSGFLKQLPLGGAEQTVVTDFDEPIREHVLEEAANELCGGDDAVPKLVSGRLFIGEGDGAVLQLTEAVVADSDAEDSGERFDGHQEVFACRTPATVSSEAAAGDDVIDVGMIAQLPGPGVEHADHAQAGADEARVLGQLQ